MDINQAIRDIVREEIAGIYADGSGEPVLISVDDAATFCGCSRSVLMELHHERAANGFPSIVLGAKTIKIDKRRLTAWFAAGGLGVKI